VFKLLILGGLAAGAFIAWKKFTSTAEDDEFADDLYGTPSEFEHAEGHGAAHA
jgi:hypothetical protein